MTLSRQHVWFALFVLAVFATGLGAGLTIARALGPGPGTPGPGVVGRPPWARPPGPPQMVQRLARDLGLSPEQQKKVEAAFEAAGTRLEQYRTRSQQELDALRDQLNKDLEAVLTPEQVLKFRASSPERRRGGPPPGLLPGPLPGSPGPPPGMPPGPPYSPGPPR